VPNRLYSIKTKRRRIKTGRLLFVLALCAFIFTILFSVRFIGTLNAIQDVSPWAAKLPEPPEGKRENLLIYAVSGSQPEALVTELVLVAYHPDKKDFRVIQLPENTLIDVENNGFMQLGQVYRAGGCELLVESVARFLTVPIHYYVQINEELLPTVIDKLGGVELPADTSIKGGDVLGLIYADGLTPSMRLECRRSVLVAISAQVVNGNSLWQLQRLKKVSPLILTNLPWRKLLSSLDSMKDINYSESSQVLLLPGREQIQADGLFWLADVNKLPLIVDWLSGDVASIPRTEITVEVLNGCGIKGIAGEVAVKLENEGFQVIRIENADRYDYAESQVIGRVENQDFAKEIAVLIPGAQLCKDETMDTSAMVTVIVGKNYPRN
jgi:anionic cell wall polymer biosynthesis LytR-Cps2A-Psr (LCP) family protein